MCLVWAARSENSIRCDYFLQGVISGVNAQWSADYHWDELWRALIGLLQYVTSKLALLKHIGRLAEVVQMVCVNMHDISLKYAEYILLVDPHSFRIRHLRRFFGQSWCRASAGGEQAPSCFLIVSR